MGVSLLDIWYAPLRSMLKSLLGWHNGGEVGDSEEILAWDDVKVSLALAKRLGNSDPSYEKLADNGSGSVGVYGTAFAHNAIQEVTFDCQLPHGYKPGTDIKFHIHWVPETTATGNVVWGLEYLVLNRNQAIGDSTIVTAAVAAPGVKREEVSLIAVIPGANLIESSVIQCRLFRATAGNTYGAKAFGLSADFHIQKNKPGTYTELPTMT